jgi:cytochrome P450
VRQKGSFVRHGLTQTECETEALFMFVAGSDTTANALRLTMLYLMATPLVYQKLKDEIAAAIRDGRASRPITSAEAREIPYLQVRPPSISPLNSPLMSLL